MTLGFRMWTMHLQTTRVIASLLFGVLACLPAYAEESQPKSAVRELRLLESGPAVGSTVQQFFVRAVTGPHRNRSVCYVCRYGARPVVMIFIQDIDPNVAKLLKSIDQSVDAGRGAGARSFGVLVTDDSGKVVSTLQTLAFDEKIDLPLTAATSVVASPMCHNLHPDAGTTVVLYRHQKVVASFGFRRGELTDATLETLNARMTKFLSEE